MARVPDLVDYCATHGLKMITVADLIESLVHRTNQFAHDDQPVAVAVGGAKSRGNRRSEVERKSPD